MADLAELLDVTPANIYYWHRRLRELATNDRKRGSSRANPGLVRVEVQESTDPETARAASSGFEIRLADSRTILVAPGFDAAALQELVTALEAC